MNRLRMIVSYPADGPGNMAADEAMFSSKINDPGLPSTIRIYTWTKPCITIGYFQKCADFAGFNMPITRRMTGGLLVVHGADVSFSFVLDDNSWEYIYDQEKTYEVIHETIKTALEKCGMKLSFVSIANKNSQTVDKSNVCVQTLFPYDLMSGNKKIVGSCQRRRGRTLLVQGSIHLPKNIDRHMFYDEWKISMGNIPGLFVEKGELSSIEIKSAEDLRKMKYSCHEWNSKF